jgi:hypothetical protein
MKTNFGKFIAQFLDTKFESTKAMGWNGKQTNAYIVFYLL